MEKVYDVAIVGGGVAGFEAALALKNFRRDFLWIGAKKFGEKLLLAENVNNFLSFTGTGKELAGLLDKHSLHEKINFTEGRIDGIYAMGGNFLLTQNKTTFTARSVILATGVETRGSLVGEREFLGRGVSYCAVCDGALYKGKRIAAVVSDRAFEEEVEYLSGFAEEVFAFCLYENARFSAPHITILKDKPISVEGGTRVEKIVTNGGDVAVDGVFFLKNSAPPSALVGGIETENGHVKVNRDMSTNIKGLFAAGDVTGRPYQYIKAAGEGLVAAYSAHEYLNSSKA